MAENHFIQQKSVIIQQNKVLGVPIHMGVKDMWEEEQN